MIKINSQRLHAIVTGLLTFLATFLTITFYTNFQAQGVQFACIPFLFIALIAGSEFYRSITYKA